MEEFTFKRVNYSNIKNNTYPYLKKNIFKICSEIKIVNDFEIKKKY